MADEFAGVVGDALLRNGQPVAIAPGSFNDVDRVRRFYDDLSDSATYYRFFGNRRRLPDSELCGTVTQDITKHVSLLASIGDELIGIGEFIVCPTLDEAEVAFCVADSHHREGVATLLLERLAVVARRNGIERFVASTLFGNEEMLLVFRTIGLAEQTRVEHEVVRVTLDLTSLDELEAQAAQRLQFATAAARCV